MNPFFVGVEGIALKHHFELELEKSRAFCATRPPRGNEDEISRHQGRIEVLTKLLDESRIGEIVRTTLKEMNENAR